MVVVTFIASLVVTGAVLSAVPSQEPGTPEADYHYVPYAGDAFGA